VASTTADTQVLRRRRTGVRRVLFEMRREWTAYLMLSPALILFAVFTLFAVVFAFYLSFHDWNILQTQKPYVGLANYRRLWGDTDFHQALQNTLYFTAANVPLTMGAGLGVALLLNQQIRLRGLFRTAYYLPVITPLVVAAIIWKWVYNGDYGLLNYYLLKSGVVHDEVLWLADPNLAMPAVIIMMVWKGLGFSMVVYLAGLQAIPQDYYDAANVDGAGAWQRLRHITLPGLWPTTFFLLIISVIGSLQVFEQIYIMTSGGPVGATRTVVYDLYLTAFKFYDMGYASAMGYALFALMFAFTLAQMRFFRRQGAV
jgi:multiple sugar transport system permease protein